jgi:ABC-type transport system involved in multi-copper enzyme maturation permease subunit
MTFSAIQSEWLKTRKRPLTLWVIGILLSAVLFYPPLMAWISNFLVIDNSQGLSIWAGPLPEEAQIAAQRMREAVTLPNIIPTMLGIAANIGRVMMVILGASLAGSEFTWGTVRHLIGRTRDRIAYVSGKLIVLIGITIILLITGLVLGTFSGSVITPLIHDGITWDFLTTGLFMQLPVALLLATLSVIPYAFFAFAIALGTRSTAAGLSIGLLTLLVGEPILAQILASLSEPWNELAYYIPYTSNQILKTWMESLIGGASPDHVGRAVAVLLGHTLAWAGLVLAYFRRRELTA